MTIYFAYRGMAPFGSDSLLTVDLGQQYVDFFAFFRRTILHHPTQFFYSFEKALGGESVGLYAYYLMSPFNLLLLFFPKATLTSGIFLITVLKYGSAGLSFAWLLQQEKIQRGPLTIAFSTAYSLMGWAIANQLNVMWLDALILLPLIILGLDRLIATGRVRHYVFWLTLMFIINYYMAYMICLFSILYFLWRTVDQFETWRNWFKRLFKFAWSSILSALLAAWILLPTFYSLTEGKTTYTVKTWKWTAEYNVPKLFGKFFMGSFNFNQMPHGTPNLFIGAFAVLGFLYFFFNGSAKLASRIAAGVVTLVLFLSVFLQPLDLLWHAGQFPVWYPYRFSFVISFWMILLAAKTLQPNFIPNTAATAIVAAVVIAITLYVSLNLNQFGYLNRDHLIYGTVALALAFALIIIPHQRLGYYPWVVLALVTVEMGMNASLSLNNISYVSQTQYGQYTDELQKITNTVQDQDQGLYRIGKTFQRDKVDPMQVGYNGGSFFGSTFEAQVPTFYGQMGNPNGDGFVVDSNGTLITDALLNYKYYFEQKDSPITHDNSVLVSDSTRADLKSYPVISTDTMSTTHQNPYALAFGYAANDAILSLKNTTLDPSQYQANWLAALTGKSRDKQSYLVQNFDEVNFKNIPRQTKLTGTILTKQDILKPATVEFKFTPKTNNSYYFTFGASLVPSNATITLNGKKLHQYDYWRNTILVNVANQAKGKPQTLTITLKKNNLWLQNFTLYELNNPAVINSLKDLKQNQLKVTHFNSHTVEGDVTGTDRKSVLATSIPYSKGWHATVNGKPVKVYRTLQMFNAIKINKGKNHVKFTYWPPYMTLGICLSLLSLITVCGTILWQKRRR
ncbi:hypothetical protein DCM90_02185 [Levilactobacillus bambusae]|uniref:Bacterial membrane protein YfhO n=2 Tax=Levilactobacillus bambusae TaxID=2024736 RepID=A0A2V1N1F2_9LACO|nr:hypothetical protein DCM90_02185 [Levilactobacillus bambusae]